MPDELKRCPFCGGEGRITWIDGDDDNDDIWVSCADCGCGTEPFTREDKAIAAWNKRYEYSDAENNAK